MSSNSSNYFKWTKEISGIIFKNNIKTMSIDYYFLLLFCTHCTALNLNLTSTNCVNFVKKKKKEKETKKINYNTCRSSLAL